MQDTVGPWGEFVSWLSLQIELLHTDPGAFGRAFMSSLWNLSVWLNDGHKGLTIALVFLVVIVNRILKRQH